MLVPGLVPFSVVEGGGGFLGVASGWCGVCGLLFENCIVDASILKTPHRARPVRGVGSCLSGGVVRDVFVICDRRRLPVVVPSCCPSRCVGVGGVVVPGVWPVGVFCDHVASFQGRTVDALASGADEGRGNLRYASGS